MVGNVKNLDSKTFKSFVKKGVSVIDFWAEWCGPCKMIAPNFEEASKEMKGKANFGKVNVDKNQDIAQEYDVMSIPTLIYFKDGKQVDRSTGVLDKEELVEKIKEVK